MTSYWVGRGALIGTLVVALTAPLSAQTYTILAEDSAGRWGQRDGTGAGNDIVKAAYQAVGRDVVLEIAPYKRAKVQVLEGKALGCFGMSWSEELVDKVLFPRNPLYRNTATILLRGEDLFRVRKPEDLKEGLVIGTVLGYEYPPAVKDLITQKQLRVEQSGSEVQNIKKLAAGRIDLVVANLDELKTADDLILEAGAVGRVGPGFELAASLTYIGFSVRHPDANVALAEFDRGMDLIRKNGTLAEILAKWHDAAP